MKLTDAMRPTTAEQRPPVLIPEPPDGAGSELRAEFDVLQARSDALQFDKANAVDHRADFMAELNAMADAATEAAESSKATAELIEDAVDDAYAVENDRAWAWEFQQVRDIAVGLLRKELALRVDLAGYVERWEETPAGVNGDGKHAGFDVPGSGKLDCDTSAANNQREIEVLRRLIRREAATLAGVG